MDIAGFAVHHPYTVEGRRGMGASVHAGPGLDLRAWSRRLIRRWWVVALCGLLGAAGGIAYAVASGPSYTAATTVLVNPPQLFDVTGTRVTVPLDMDDELAYALSDHVAGEAQRLLSTPTDRSTLLSRLSVTVPPNTSILAFAYAAPTPEEAVDGAAAYARAYLSLRNLETAQATAMQLQDLTSQTTAALRQLDFYTARVGTLPPTSAARAFALAQTPILQSRLASLNQRTAQLTAGDTDYGTMVDPATLPLSASSPPALLLGLGGLLAGLAAGVLLAAFLGSRDRRIRTVADVPAMTGLDVLHAVRPERRRTQPVLASQQARADFDRLRLRLTGDVLDRARSVLVCSDHPGRAAGYVAANLTAAHVRAGRVVVLVCASPTSPAAPMLGVPGGDGLDALLVRGESLEAAVAPVPSMRMARALTAGTDLDLGSETVTASGVAAVTDALVRSGACVVVEGPGRASDPATLELARHAHSCALVVELGVSRAADVRAAAVELQRAGVVSVAVVTVPRLRGNVEAPPQPHGGSESQASSREPVNA